MEVTSHRKRRREVDGAKEGVKRRKEDKEQHLSIRGKAVETFVAAAEGVYANSCGACGGAHEM